MTKVNDSSGIAKEVEANQEFQLGTLDKCAAFKCKIMQDDLQNAICKGHMSTCKDR